MPNTKSAEGRALLKQAYLDFTARLEQLSGKSITVESLKAGIETVNAKRRAMHRLAALRRANPAPISGLDALLANQVFFYDDPQRFTENANKLCDELEQRVEQKIGSKPADAPRIHPHRGLPGAAPRLGSPSMTSSSLAE